MGFFDDIEEMLDGLVDELDEEVGAADHDISVEIVKGKEDLDKRVRELEDEGYTLVEVQKKLVRNGKEAEDQDEEEEEDEDLPEDDEDEEALRMKAKQQFGRMVKENGLDKAIMYLDRAMYRGAIDNLLEKGLPLDPDAVANYNRLARELSECDPETLEVIYMVTNHFSVKKRKEIFDGRFA